MTRVSGRHESSTHQRTHSIICDCYLFLWMKLRSWVETPAHFFVPFLSVLISMMFMPRQARETNIRGGGWEEKEGLHVFLEPLSLSCVFGGVSAN